MKKMADLLLISMSMDWKITNAIFEAKFVQLTSFSEHYFVTISFLYQKLTNIVPVRNKFEPNGATELFKS